MTEEVKVDIVVIGAGFSGSLTALGLEQLGYDVALIEKDTHPRFAIGESSTPVADLILRDLSDRYSLPWLRDISRYGCWQQTYPNVTCGLKRGFSYFNHKKDQSFQSTPAHDNELLVAASTSNDQSDTNWFRYDVDSLFVENVKKTSISYWDNTEIIEIERPNVEWHIKARQFNKKCTFHCTWMIEASGSSDILQQLGISIGSKNFHTNTKAIFSHFSDVKPWQDWLLGNNTTIDDYPYNPDNSALHHLLDEGWLWMLRFNNGVTSAGLVFNCHKNPKLSDNANGSWSGIINQYPSLKEIFEDANILNPPGHLIQSKRLQRRAEKAAGPGWVALPHTIGFVDPLHSMGIAHSLSGVERILHSFEVEKDKPDNLDRRFQRYEHAVFKELDFMDLLVDGCYRSMDDFELFHIYLTLYFISAITYEQKRIKGMFEIGDLFLSADHPDINKLTVKTYRNLLTLLSKKTIRKEHIRSFRDAVEKEIEPFNTARLLHSEIPHMYFHTSAKF
jgi:FADH2 O2-dependent halogenase